MGIPESQIVNLNKSRMRAIYWRPDGKGNWFQTSPLPAAPASANAYILKGFKANPPGGVDTGLIQCPMCEFGAQSAFGLQAHLRKHIQKTTDDVGDQSLDKKEDE